MCSPGEFPNDFTERMIEKYSEKVNDDGFFLGVADAFLFAVKQGKSFAIAVDPQPDRALEVLSARDYLCGILPENIQIERREGDDLDTKSPDSWCIVSCDAKFAQEGERNHYVPAIFKDQLTQDEWFDRTVLGQRSTRNELREKEQALRTLDSDL